MCLARVMAPLLGLAAATLGASGAHAQAGPGLAEALSRPHATAPAPTAGDDGDDRDGEDGEDGEHDAPAERPWVGPQIDLGYSYLKLSDGHGGGDAHSAELEVFVQLPFSEIRLGLGGAMGARDYSLAGEDLLARGFVELGFQLTELIDPFVPYLSVIGTFGALVGSRFESTVAYALGGAGLELGGMLRLYRNLHLSMGFGYQRWEMDGAGFDLFTFRAAVGL